MLARASLFVSLAFASPALAAPVAFIADGGNSNIASGNFSGTAGDTLIVNAFDAGPGGATINQIAYVYSTPACEGFDPVIPISVVLFEDDDDDGSLDNSTLLVQLATVPTNIFDDVFNVVAIPSTFVTGTFFVGVFAEDTLGVGFVGAFQSFGQPDVSRIFAGLDLDLDDVLGTADIFAFDSDPFDTVALIRAFGETADVPAPGAVGLLGLGALALLGGRSRGGAVRSGRRGPA